MSSLKPLVLYGTSRGPNPWKVAIILEELGLPYEFKVLQFSELKAEPFVSLNPNGRVPALEDPNTGLTLFESGAIIEYLVGTYDKEAKLTYTDDRRWQLLSWLHFQMSGQGPYYGQKVWFSKYHAEKLPSAIDRYANEIKRVVGVIDRHLKKQGTPYLVGDKCTFADLAWVPWHQGLDNILLPGWDYRSEFPDFARWNQSLNDRESVKKVDAAREKAIAAEETAK